MRYLIILPVLAGLTACSTPRENCIYQANSQLRSLEYQIETAQGNIDRGFAVFRSTQEVEIEATCTDRLPDGTLETYDCDRTETTSVSNPVAIDVNEERRKLAGLQSQLAALQAATFSAEQQCIAIHPE